jgi:hypothetical protein
VRVVRALERGAEARVWQIVASGEMFALKVHDRPGGCQQETQAYRRLGDAFAGRVPMPRLCGPRFLLLPWIDGARAAELVGERRSSAFFRAGEFVRDLRASPEISDEMALADAMALRARRWIDRAEPFLSLARRDRLRRRLLALSDLNLPPRTLCHRDFTPSNWIVDQKDQLWVIDWGQARGDFWLWDLAKLSEADFLDQPACREAFFEGLGRPPSTEEEDALSLLGLLHGLQSLVWGRQHGDESIAALGQAIIDRRLSSYSSEKYG